jgi:hypothetical protein
MGKRACKCHQLSTIFPVLRHPSLPYSNIPLFLIVGSPDFEKAFYLS